MNLSADYFAVICSLADEGMDVLTEFLAFNSSDHFQSKTKKNDPLKLISKVE